LPSAWDSWIAPETLLSQVRSTAPFLEPRLTLREPGRLIELAGAPDGFLRILASWENILAGNLTREEQLQDYFALCLACHHATVATFVPTDVDTKIRGILWLESRDPEVLRPMLGVALASRFWTEEGISIRAVRGVSGHNGEQWSAIAGGLGRLLLLGDRDAADEALTAIEIEIDREQLVFDAVAAERGAELDLLRLSMTLAHNRGDLTQGMGFWKRTPVTAPLQEHLSARGRFAAAVRIYQHTGLSAEGHRHYPLRPVKPLRRSPDTLLPLCPFLDEWGTKVARMEESHEVLEALVTGCHKVEGQQGYYRAIAGMREAGSGAFDRAASRMSNGAQRLLRDSGLRKLIDVPRGAFESMMRKRARAALALFASITIACSTPHTLLDAVPQDSLAVAYLRIDQPERVLAWNGKELLTISAGTPAGYTSIAPGISAFGSPERIEAARKFGRGASDLPSGDAPIRAFVRGSPNLPLNGDLQNVATLLRMTQLTTVSGNTEQIEAVARCRSEDLARRFEESLRAIATLLQRDVRVTRDGLTVHVSAKGKLF
jgi:hypothetical protein